MQGATYHCAKPQLISSSITPKRRTLPVLQFLCDQSKRSSASRSTLNGRRKWLQDNFALSGRDLPRAIEHCHVEQAGIVVCGN